jgi:hypothetical protein
MQVIHHYRIRISEGEHTHTLAMISMYVLLTNIHISVLYDCISSMTLVHVQYSIQSV